MLSLSEYYQRFKADLLSLQALSPSSTDNLQIKAALGITEIGLMLEQQSDPYAIKSLVGEIGKLAEKLGPQVTLLTGNPQKPRQYPLPELSDNKSLLFAIAYHKHLDNYQHASYQGPITTYWGIDARSRIVASLEKKRRPNQAQAAYLKRQILEHCDKHDLDLKEDELLPQGVVDAAHFYQTLANKLTKHHVGADTPNNVVEAKRSAVSDIDKLKQSIIALQTSLESLHAKSKAHEQATQVYLEKTEQYMQKSWFVRLAHLLISWFYPVAALKELSRCKETCTRLKDAITPELSGAPDKVSRVISLHGDISQAIEALQLLEQAKNKEAEQCEKHATVNKKPSNQLLKFDFNKSSYGFFNEPQVLGATAAAALALATQHIVSHC